MVGKFRNSGRGQITVPLKEEINSMAELFITRYSGFPDGHSG